MAKYAKLYANANDEWVQSLNSETVHKTHKLYDYTLQQQKALRNEEAAARRSKWIIVLLVGLVMLTMYIYNLILHAKQRKAEIRALSTKYQNTSKEYQQTLSDIEKLKKNEVDILAEKEQKILELQEIKEQLEDSYSRIEEQEKKKTYYQSDAVQKLLTESASDRPNITKVDVVVVIELFKQSFPRFCQAFDAYFKLSELEWIVIVLTDLSIQPSVISVILGVSTARISGIKKQINNVLFQDTGAATMAQNLKNAMNSTDRNEFFKKRRT